MTMSFNPAHESAPKKSFIDRLLGANSETDDARKAAAARAAAEHAAENAAAEKIAQVNRDISEYWNLVDTAIYEENKGRDFHLAVVQGGGGAGKTFVATYVGDTLANVARRGTIGVDTNDMMGNFWPNCTGGKRDGTITVKGTDALLKEKAKASETLSSAEFDNLLGTTRSGLKIIAADRDMGVNERYAPEMIERVIAHAQAKDPNVIVDTNNEVQGDCNTVVLRMNRSVIIPSTHKTSELRRAGLTYLSSKAKKFDALAENAIFVISAVKPEHDLKELRDQINYELTGEQAIPNEQVVFYIPFDPWIDAGKPVILEKLQPLTQIAIAEVTLAAIRVNNHLAAHEADPTKEFRPLRQYQGRMVKLTSGRLPQLPYVNYEDQVPPAPPKPMAAPTTPPVVDGVYQAAP
jgi:MinD-like ATPase involved in chromosome partitioning or flagellar assembly